MLYHCIALLFSSLFIGISIWISWMGLSENPLKRIVIFKGLSVGSIYRYARIGRTANPRIQVNCVQGCLA